MKKLAIIALCAFAAVPAFAAEEIRGGALLEKAIYSPGELLNRKFTVKAATGHKIETIRDSSTGKMYQKIYIAPEVGKYTFFAMAQFYCINVNSEPIEVKKAYTFDAAYLETQVHMPEPGIAGQMKEAIFVCGNFR